jgi:hypothetical protein
VEDDLEKQIAEFLGQMQGIVFLRGADDFPGFLHHIGLQGLMSLFPVPGTTAGGPEAVHDLHKILQGFPGTLLIGKGSAGYGGEMIIEGLTVQLVEGNRQGFAVAGQEQHGFLVPDPGGERLFDFAGGDFIVQLSDQQGTGGSQTGSVKGSGGADPDIGGGKEGPAGGQIIIRKGKAGYEPDFAAFGPGREQRVHGAVGQDVGDRVHKIRAGSGEGPQLLRGGAGERVEIIGGFIEMVEGAESHSLRLQPGGQGMEAGA